MVNETSEALGVGDEPVFDPDGLGDSMGELDFGGLGGPEPSVAPEVDLPPLPRLPLLPDSFFENGGASAEAIADHLREAASAINLKIVVTDDKRVLFYSDWGRPGVDPVAVISSIIIARKSYFDLQLRRDSLAIQYVPLFQALKSQIDDAQPAIKMLSAEYLSGTVDQASILSYLRPSVEACGLEMRLHNGSLGIPMIFFSFSDDPFRFIIFTFYPRGKRGQGDVDYHIEISWERAIEINQDVPYFRLLLWQIHEIRNSGSFVSVTPEATVDTTRAETADVFGSGYTEVDDGVILEITDVNVDVEPSDPPRKIVLDELITEETVKLKVASGRFFYEEGGGMLVNNDGVVIIPRNVSVTIRSAINARFFVEDDSSLILQSASHCTIQLSSKGTVEIVKSEGNNTIDRIGV